MLNYHPITKKDAVAVRFIKKNNHNTLTPNLSLVNSVIRKTLS